MPDPREELVRVWLELAVSDIRSARALAEQQPPLFDTAMFHLQQAAEKSIKAFLSWQNATISKTHDIVLLLNAAAEFESRFDGLEPLGQLLTPFAVELRYPFGYPAPSEGEFREAHVACVAIFDFVLDAVPESTHPATELIRS
ncbi:HEPN domain-containing protein [bacterium]|nr:HEPN domain-containing protein [bacterium]